MSKPTSTTAQGNTFRDGVAQLIRLSPNCSNVKTELRLGSQDVDIYYEEQTSFGVVRVGCECKDYGKPLTKTFIAEKIYSRYHPLRDGPEEFIDQIRIIAPLDPGPEAKAFLHQSRISFSTKDDLECEIINFRSYVRTLLSLYNNDGLDNYYVQPVLSDNKKLEDVIDKWIDGEGHQPIAILAGYGMGKTSFARRLAYRLASQLVEGRKGRIPILIPLAEISNEQTLDGLLGKIFSSQNQVFNYHFQLFLELNRRGRFVVILDGFDEMKHTMTWNEFKHNLKELNQLVTINSRTLLLGRPSAFLSDREYSYAIRGIDPESEIGMRVPDAPEYLELSLQEFTLEQALEFIERYADYRRKSYAATRGPTYEIPPLEPRLASIKSDDQLRVIIQRPVQARMLADLAIDPAVEWQSFSRYELYRTFIRRIIERDSDKPTRSTFDSTFRIKFHERLAWWIWGKASGAGFHLSELRRDVLGDYPADVGATNEGIKRDLISGSLLERKLGDIFYFAHRSFVEFLVAQHIVTEQWSAENLASVSDALSPEIDAFIRDSGSAAKVAEWQDSMDQIPGQLTLGFFELVAWAQEAQAINLEGKTPSNLSPRNLTAHYARLTARNTPTNEVVNFLCRTFSGLTDTDSKLMAVFLLVLAETNAAPQFKSGIRLQIFSLVLIESLPEIRRLCGQSGNESLAFDTRDPFVRLLARSFKRSKASVHEIAIEVHAGTLVDDLDTFMPIRFRLLNAELSWFETTIFRLADLAGFGERFALTRDGAHIAKFFRLYPDPSQLVHVNSRNGRL